MPIPRDARETNWRQIHGSYHVVEFTGMKVAFVPCIRPSQPQQRNGLHCVSIPTTTFAERPQVVLPCSPPKPNRGMLWSPVAAERFIGRDCSGITPIFDNLCQLFFRSAAVRKLVVIRVSMSPDAAVSRPMTHVTRPQTFLI
jgi:hypothetical protein